MEPARVDRAGSKGPPPTSTSTPPPPPSVSSSRASWDLSDESREKEKEDGVELCCKMKLASVPCLCLKAECQSTYTHSYQQTLTPELEVWVNLEIRMHVDGVGGTFVVSFGVFPHLFLFASYPSHSLYPLIDKDLNEPFADIFPASFLVLKCTIWLHANFYGPSLFGKL